MTEAERRLHCAGEIRCSALAKLEKISFERLWQDPDHPSRYDQGWTSLQGAYKAFYWGHTEVRIRAPGQGCGFWPNGSKSHYQNIVNRSSFLIPIWHFILAKLLPYQISVKSGHKFISYGKSYTDPHIHYVCFHWLPEKKSLSGI